MTKNKQTNYRDIFIKNIKRIREKGYHALLSGISIDNYLVQELNSPGTDMRCGVNLVCYPSDPVVKHIIDIQNYLRSFEPDQYYYPSTDLHLTLVEICHSRTTSDAKRIAEGILPQINFVLENLSSPKLDSPMLTFSARGVALNFLPSDHTLQNIRCSIRERLRQIGFPIAARYEATSAHLSLMRYISSLQNILEKWVSYLCKAPQCQDLNWTLSTLWLTWGVNWYGMQSRITKAGPFSLSKV